mmetsp:Transcript_3810/g.11325  ORF Transcript_3810/g.11325 Transcript_3810/m.11325 type:complete len:110 (-) Transcript_3810:55-384(-)
MGDARDHSDREGTALAESASTCSALGVQFVRAGLFLLGCVIGMCSYIIVLEAVREAIRTVVQMDPTAELLIAACVQVCISAAVFALSLRRSPLRQEDSSGDKFIEEVDV